MLAFSMGKMSETFDIVKDANVYTSPHKSDYIIHSLSEKMCYLLPKTLRGEPDPPFKNYNLKVTKLIMTDSYLYCYIPKKEFIDVYAFSNFYIPCKTFFNIEVLDLFF